MADENVQLGWRIPPAVRDKFKEYCDDVGSDYGDSLAAAMTIWQHLPASIQRQSHLEVAGKQGGGSEVLGRASSRIRRRNFRPSS